MVKPVGINLQAYRSLPTKREARLQLGLPQDAFLVLYIGNLLETKGIRELLQALQELRAADPSTIGVFVGGGELQDEVKQTPHMVCAGVQPNRRIPLYLAAVDLLVLPSYREGLPTVLVEAGAAGTPVVATNVGGIPELLGDGRGSMVTAKSVKALKQAIKDVREKKNDASARARRLKEYVFEHYDADSNAQKLIILYEGLVAKVPQAVE
jgi:teichuronic acid biosynthesis glycosyltransferase TuaC